MTSPPPHAASATSAAPAGSPVPPVPPVPPALPWPPADGAPAWPVPPSGGPPPPRRAGRVKAVVAVLAGVVALAALAGGGWWWAQRAAARDALRQAHVAWEKGDVVAARLHLREHLRHQPEDAAAHLMLGRVGISEGYFPGAEEALRRADAQGASPDEVLPLLAQALAELGKPSTAIDELQPSRLTTPLAKARVLVYQARVLLREGKPRAAEAALAEVRRLAPALPELAVTEVFQLAQTAGHGAAADRLLAVSERHPEHLEAQMLHVRLLQQAGRLPEAVARARTLVARVPQLAVARATLAELLITQGELAAAETELKALASLPLGRLDAALMQASIQVKRGQLDAAAEAMAKLMKAAPNHPPVLRAAADLALAQGRLDEAAQHLQRVVHLRPLEAPARMALADVQLRLGDVDGASQALEPVVRRVDADGPALTLAGQVAARAGDARAAAEFFQRAARLAPQDPAAARRAAVGQLAAGDTRRGMERLQELSDQGNDPDAAVMLLLAHLQAGRGAEAQQVLKRLEARLPTSGWLLNLKGLVAEAGRDLAVARRHYEAAAAKPHRFGPALLNLVRLDAAMPDGAGLAAAQARLNEALAARPDDAPTLSALAEVRRRQGAPWQEVAQLLEKAHAAKPEHLPAQLSLARWYMAGRALDKAKALAEQAVKAHPKVLDAVLLQADLLLAEGRGEDAVLLLNGYTPSKADTVRTLQARAQAHAAVQDWAGALAMATRVQALSPDDAGAVVAVAQLQARTGRPREAQRALQQLAKRPNVQTQAQATAALGELWMSEKNWGQAETAFRQSLAAAPSGGAAIGVYQALQRQGQAEAASAWAKGWVGQHPQDLGFQQHLADALLAKGQWPAAKQAYLALLPKARHSAALLNNLAYACLKTQDPCAKPQAQAALALSPGHPDLLDTLAQVVLAEGDAAAAVGLFQQAVKAAPDNAQATVGLAQALAKSGQAGEARQRLKDLLARAPQFDGRAEAEALLQSLP